MTCGSCPYFASIDTSNGMTECRKLPPTTITLLGKQGVTIRGVFPPTVETMWCGEHPARKDRDTLGVQSPPERPFELLKFSTPVLDPEVGGSLAPKKD